MQSVTLICVGRLRERHYEAAFAEYEKRLGGLCRFECIELAESRLPETPGDAELAAALLREAREIKTRIPRGAYTVALCIEGRELSSVELSELIESRKAAGDSKFCFIIGGSYGLHESVKREAQLRLSMSPMTFPHHLARVMLAEQLYRALSIGAGSRYHK